MNLTLRRRKQTGLSTVQVAIGVMVMVVLLVGALGGYKYLRDARINNEIEFINHLKVSTMRYGLVASAFNNANVNLSVLNGQGFWNHPAVTYVDANTVRNQWGGTIVVLPTTRITPSDAIYFRTTNVPKSACVEIAGGVDRLVGAIVVNGRATKVEEVRTNTVGLAQACNDQNFAAATVELYIHKHSQ